jgi:hypothetical protein
VDVTEKPVLRSLYDSERALLQVAVVLKDRRIDVDIDHDISAGEATA